ncbi:hypothetical protein [Vibrio sp. SCSIO 43136]|uniref:hypothetical protein n=1 Tax=Vibrio sp. SCSIO 43136 TaxID=2819101 RepID=UPI002076265B|nr:hypothetical protein [Vibrio sp. SCSIO 43136]USD67258.1 hypothetical protein J4N39_21745 [Vibrio sp. SCSIO 43136]
MTNFIDKLKHAISDVLDFRNRVWVVNVFAGPQKGESFVVNEDGFSAPLEWMTRKGYDDTMLKQVEAMPRSQVLEFDLGVVKHRLMRVK